MGAGLILWLSVHRKDVHKSHLRMAQHSAGCAVCSKICLESITGSLCRISSTSATQSTGKLEGSKAEPPLPMGRHGMAQGHGLVGKLSLVRGTAIRLTLLEASVSPFSGCLGRLGTCTLLV